MSIFFLKKNADKKDRIGGIGAFKRLKRAR